MAPDDRYCLRFGKTRLRNIRCTSLRLTCASRLQPNLSEFVARTCPPRGCSCRPVSDGRVSDVVHEGSVQPPSASAQEAPAPGEGDAAPNPEGKPEGRSGVGNGARRSTVAEATVTGTLNGKPLRLKRRKGTRVNQLFLEYGGEDLTRQVAR